MTVQTPREEANDMVETLRYDPLKRLERSGEYVDACLAEVHAAVPRDVLQEPLVPPPASSRSPRSSRSPLRTMPLAAPPSLAGDDVDALLASAPAPDSSSARKPAPFARTAQFARRAAAPKVLVVERRGLSPAWLAFAVVASAVTVAVAVRVLGGPFAQGTAVSSPAAEGAPLAAELPAVAPERAAVAPPAPLAPAAAPTPIVATVVAPATPTPATGGDAKPVSRAAAPATSPVAATKDAKAPHEAASPSKAPHAPVIATEPHAASKAKPAAAPVSVAKEPTLSGEARSEKAARPKAKPREPAPDQSLGDAQLNAAFR